MRSPLVRLLGLVAALAFVPDAAAQTRVLTGRVYDVATQQGVPGAILSVVGGTQATQANDAGQYRLTIPAGDVTLAVRGLGYRQQQVRAAAGAATLDVGMSREAIKLSEVVVTGAATTQERRNVSAAVSTVSAEEVSRVPAVSLDNALQGKVIGANINMNSGAPGGGGQIQIRGVTSILGNGEPLYVVDGVIISNAAFSTGMNAVSRASTAATAITTTQDNAANRLADINPNDIESVQILKAAAATAIYGSKATNGVIIINTKRGRTGAPQFSLSTRAGMYTPTRLLGSRKFTNATLADLAGQTLANQYCPGTATTACPYYDYQGELYGQNQMSYDVNATMSGGSTEGTRYFLSASDKNDRGTLMSTGARFQNLRMNLDQVFGSRWTTSVTASINRTVADRGISNNDNTYTSPFYAFGYTPAVENLQARVGGRYVNNTIIEALYSSGSNPFQTLESLKNREDVWRTLGSANVRFAAFTSAQHTLSVGANGGFDRYGAESQVYSPNFLQFEPDDGLPGTAVQGEGLSRQFNGTLSAIHAYTPGEGGMIPFLSSATTSAGIQGETRFLNRYLVQARGLVPGIDYVDQGTPTLTHFRTQVRDQAFFASEEILAFDEMLSLSGRVRGERSSVNGNPKQFYYWPAVGASYRIVGLIPFVDELKLRANVGTSGNQPNYGFNSLVVAGLGSIDGRNALGVPGTIGNTSIKPERMTEQELGFDALFWNSRVGLEATYFDRAITDLLLTAPLPPSSGYSQRYINGGELGTTGIELALNLTPLRTSTMTWNFRTQYYSSETVVKALPDGVADFVVSNSGFGAAFGRGRIARDRKATLIWGNKFRPDGTVVDTALADANPDFTMQFSSDFTWKRFTVNGLLDWRKGGAVSNMTQVLFDEGANSWDYDHPVPAAMAAAGKTAAARAATKLGEFRYLNWSNGQNAGQYIQDGSFVKLREITVAFQLPETLVARVLPGTDDARLMVTGRNLAMWSDYWSMDPEVNNFGNQNVVRFVDLAPYPPSRSVFVGLDLRF